MTINELQQTVDRWITTTGGGYFSHLTNALMLAEETGEVARIIARTHGDQIPKATDNISTDRLSDELADVVWIAAALANQSGINLTEAIAKNLAKKNIRDAERFIKK